MKRTYKFHPGVYELGENEKFYSDMEAKGWRLVKRGQYLSRFERVEPSRARYRVEIYTPPFLEQSVLPEEQLAVFEDCGWEYVADYGSLHIFRAPEGSDAPEFYTDPAQQAETLKKLRRNRWWGLGWSALVLAAAVLLPGLGGSFSWARHVKRFIQAPTAYTFYLFWLAWALWQAGVEGWKLNRTYRRLKKGEPLDHNPKGNCTLHKVLNRGLLGLTLLSMLVLAVQFLTMRSTDLPAQPDGPYIMLSDIGWEGEPGKLYHQDPGVNRAWSLLTDYWEVLEVVDPGNQRQVWMRQEVYRLRFPGLVPKLAWALREDAVLARSAESFHPLEVPGLDAAWATDGLELVAVKGNLIAYVEFLSSGMGGEFDPVPICEALAARWAEG